MLSPNETATCFLSEQALTLPQCNYKYTDLVYEWKKINIACSHEKLAVWISEQLWKNLIWGKKMRNKLAIVLIELLSMDYIYTVPVRGVNLLNCVEKQKQAPG